MGRAVKVKAWPQKKRTEPKKAPTLPNHVKLRPSSMSDAEVLTLNRDHEIS